MSINSIAASMSVGAVPQPVVTPPTGVPLLFLFWGDSISGGLAPNTSATSEELAPRSEVQLLKNLTLDGFYDLDIGTNNLIAHGGLGYAMYTAHGCELQLANRVALGDLPNPVYLAKCGQGGSIVDYWQVGAAYYGEGNEYFPYDDMVERVAAAVALITAERGEPPFIFSFMSLGANDRGGPSWNAATYEADMIELIGRARTDIGQDFPVCLVKYNDLGMTDFDDAVDNIAATLADVYALNTTGYSKIDSVHFDYLGNKQLADDFINIYLVNYA